MFEPNPTNFGFFVNFSCGLGPIMTRYDFRDAGDFTQYTNYSKFEIFTLLVNFSCELGYIVARLDLIAARQIILSSRWTQSPNWSARCY